MKPTHEPVPPAAVLLTLDSRVARQSGVVLRQVAGESMLVPTVTREVDLDSLFLLNATGVFVWERLEGGPSVRALAEAVAARFGAAPETALADVTRFLESLLDRKLAASVENHGH